MFLNAYPTNHQGNNPDQVSPALRSVIHLDDLQWQEGEGLSIMGRLLGLRGLYSDISSVFSRDSLNPLT